VIESNSLVPLSAATRATTAKTSSASTWAMISTSCRRADSSVPITQIAVISRISAMVRICTSHWFSTRSSRPKASSR
jgi:hypothetical protein